MTDPAIQKTNRIMDKNRVLMTEAVHAQQEGKFAEAERLYETILAGTPQHADALHFLGLLKHQRDGSAESIELMRRSLEHGIPNAGYMVNYGKVLQAYGRFEESIEQFKKAAALSPSFADSWTGLGQSYEQMRMPFKASAYYRKAYEAERSAPGNAMNLARSLRNTGELTEAAALCAEALRANPEHTQFLYLQILCLLDAGKAEEALSAIRAALRADPLSAQLQYSTGLVMSELGDFAAAKEHFQKALAIDPQYYAVCYSQAVIQKAGTTDVAMLEQRLRQTPPQTQEAAVFAEFSLGKMLEDTGEYDLAFEHFRIGNKVMRQLSGYNNGNAAQKIYVDGLLRHLDAGFMQRAAAAGNASVAPIFIVGMIRSGTSLVEQILTCHPDVAGGGELPFLPQTVSKFAEIPYVVTGEKIASLSDADLKAMGAHYLAKLEEFRPGAKHVTDKLPGNFMLIGLIRTLFPKARIIHCQRDPLDTCLSCYLTHFDNGHQYAYDLAEVGEYYLQYRRILDYYQGVMSPGAMLSVSYEELVMDLEKGARHLLEFCGLQWDPACLQFDKAPRLVQTASMYQVRQPVSRSSVGKWRRYEKHIEPLRHALGLLVSGQ